MMNLKTELMPHQRDAFDKASRHKVGALFMDMGTGKSRVAIELIHFYRKRGVKKAIWICPVNTKSNVAREIEKHSSGLSVIDISSRACKDNADALIVGTESIGSSDRIYLKLVELMQGALLIVDESHDFKSPGAKRVKRLLQHAHKTAARYVMTGTPITKGFEDLFCQIHMLSDKILGYQNYRHFAHYHLAFDPKHKGRIKSRMYGNYVTTKITPYVYQVKKDECLSLPPKTYLYSHVTLPSEQVRAYEKARDDILSSDEFMSCESGVMVYKLFSTLQRIACGVIPLGSGQIQRLYENPSENPRIKDLVYNIERMPNDAQVIVWAKYTTDIEDIKHELTSRYGADQVCVMHGKTPQNERDAVIQKYRNGARFFVSNAATGGIGLTLNEASYVVFYSQSFKYIERAQAEDRCHRIGQEKNVHYITIESQLKIDLLIGDVLARRSNVVDEFRREVDAIKKQHCKKAAAKLIKKLRSKL